MSRNQITPGPINKNMVNMNPFFQVLRVLGLAPYHKDYGKSLAWRLYNLLLVAIITVTGVSFFHVFVTNYQAGGMTTQRFISGLLSTLSIMFSSTSAIIFSTTKTNDRFKYIFVNLEKIDEILNRDSIYNVRRRRGVYLSVACTFVIVFSLTTIEYMYLGSFYRALVIMRYFMNMVYSVTNIQFTGMVVMLRVRHASINERLQALQAAPEDTEHPPKSKILINHIKHSRFPTITPKQRVVNDINTLRQAHNLLHQTSEHINAIFGFKILANILHILLTIVTCNYLFTSRVLIVADIEGVTLVMFCVSTLGWWLYSHFFMFAIAKICTQTIEETNKTSFLVQKCMFSRQLGGDARDELRTFAKQLQSNKLLFTACGIFDLNMTLLLSVAGTVTTYTILLLTPDKK